MKKFLMVIGGLAILLVAAMIIIPLVVDVDKYRPQLVQMVNERINGKFELGKLKLSLWGQVRVEIAGLSLQDSGGRPVVNVTDAHLHIPLSSIFGGSPSIELRMDKPTLAVVKSKSGKLNVMTLMKDAPAAPPAASGESKSVALPALATQARMTIELNHAQLAYRDEATQLVSMLKDLNVVLRDVSLTRTSEIEIWADLDTSMAKVFTVKGPARITGKAKPEIAGGKLDKISITAKADLDGLSISVPGVFEKKNGVACNADLAISASSKESRIEKMDIRFFNAQLTGEGSMTQEPPMVKFKAASNAIDLKAWGELMPMVKEYDVTGTGKIDVVADGPVEKLNYQATVRADNITAKTPMVKTRPQIDALVIVKPDVVDTISATMKAPGTDLKIRGRMVSFDAPKLDLKIESTGMDLDQWVDFPKPTAGAKAAANAPAAEGGGEGGGKTAAAGKSDYDAMLEPLRKNPMMSAFSGKLDVGIKFIKAYGVRVTDVNGDVAMKDLAVKMNSFGFKVWNGSVKTAASMQLKPKTPTYQFNAGITGLEIQQAVESQFALFKNTLLGKASFEMAGEGASFNPDPAIANLKAKGKLRVDNATFATIDVARMASEGINGALEKIGDKIPNLKGRKVNIGNGGKSLYEYVSTTFVIDKGMFSAPDFYAKAVPQKGIELKGATQVGMQDYSLKTDWEIIDTYDLTGGRQLSVEQSGVQVPHILAEGNGPVKFPVSAGCKITAPCYSYGQVPEFLAKVALNNVTQAVAGKAKAEVQKKIESVIPKAAPPAIQNQLKKLFGR